MTTTAELPFRASRYTMGAIILHWTIALFIVAQIVGGYAMNDILERGSAQQYDLFQMHKSLGITILVLTVGRIMWRLFNPPPAEPESVGRREGIVAHWVHILFYALLLIIPLSGWLIISVSSIRVETVLFFQNWLPWPDLPLVGALSEGSRDVLNEASEEVHGFLAYSTGALLVLHAAGAIKHHIADGNFLTRMSPFAGGDGPRNSYGHAVTWLTMVIFFGAIVGAAAWSRYGDDWVAGNEPAATAATTSVSPDQAAVLGSGAMTAAETPVAIAAAAPDAAPAADSTPAAGTAPAAETAPAGTAPLWTIDTSASTLGYAFIYQDNRITGTLPDFTAEVRFDENNLAASSISATVDLESVAPGEGSLTLTQIKGADGLDTAKAATAEFRAATIEKNADGGFLARGTLSLRGVDAPVDLPFTLTPSGDNTIAEGTARLTREAFGFGEASSLGAALGPDVEVQLRLVAKRADAASDAIGR
ncbi:cytochrome b/b6 domain-containing protein [Acuticoccus sp. MNP-M23]|uniref:cytochrome b/b6 domain-containing protein n=1 Tax=Acuticoccus sp. MNP-M23 TaxID=3072793 RepID=UPI002815311C|nr:cytochrome b/b6 domain-containing protein [Acuticoccus sp. MNP-M23]WMS44928.1 cytochrome b/b6 domain-containing protein [Acuticoccus sp. MNP-M23]